MGRIFDALQRSTGRKEADASVISSFAPNTEIQGRPDSEVAGLFGVRSLNTAATPEKRLVTLDGQRSLGSEKIRILAAKLRHLQDQRSIKRLLITSSVKDEGKTVLSANLAISFAKMKQRVLLIDGDCHHANAGLLLGANGSPGLSDWWRSEQPIETYLMRVNGLPLWFLPAGGPLDQVLEMLQSTQVLNLLSKMTSWFDWVVIDSPPSAPLADSAVWARLADGILLVTRNGRTPKRLLRKVLESLEASKLLGIVLNDCSDPDQRYYAHYYYTLHNDRQSNGFLRRFSRQRASKSGGFPARTE
ncbi:MAG TPA: CpsD/CapB family tyrosine-protein kinase [Candidatus Angelobacter sp.]|nr:CpsD/CapB family tyrosine-protein kinase [Candidatus Angelobacter sp.]